jgi:hypothetical protein
MATYLILLNQYRNVGRLRINLSDVSHIASTSTCLLIGQNASYKIRFFLLQEFFRTPTHQQVQQLTDHEPTGCPYSVDRQENKRAVPVQIPTHHPVQYGIHTLDATAALLDHTVHPPSIKMRLKNRILVDEECDLTAALGSDQPFRWVITLLQDEDSAVLQFLLAG